MEQGDSLFNMETEYAILVLYAVAASKTIEQVKQALHVEHQDRDDNSPYEEKEMSDGSTPSSKRRKTQKICPKAIVVFPDDDESAEGGVPEQPVVRRPGRPRGCCSKTKVRLMDESEATKESKGRKTRTARAAATSAVAFGIVASETRRAEEEESRDESGARTIKHGSQNHQMLPPPKGPRQKTQVQNDVAPQPQPTERVPQMLPPLYQLPRLRAPAFAFVPPPGFYPSNMQNQLNVQQNFFMAHTHRSAGPPIPTSPFQIPLPWSGSYNNGVAQINHLFPVAVSLYLEHSYFFTFMLNKSSLNWIEDLRRAIGQRVLAYPDLERQVAPTSSFVFTTDTLIAIKDQNDFRRYLLVCAGARKAVKVNAMPRVHMGAPPEARADLVSFQVL